MRKTTDTDTTRVNQDPDAQPLTSNVDWARSILDDAARKRLEEAVVRAEKRTSGEIVPMLVQSSAATGHVAPLLLLLLCTLGLAGLDAAGLSTWWSVALLAGLSIPATLGLSRIPWLRRLLTTRADLERQVFMRAHLEFLSAGLDRTQGATGVLIFVSWAERRVVVLADRAISDLLPPQTWETVRDALLAGIRRGDTAGGFVAAIDLCADILEKHFPVKADDVDELPNTPIVRS
ncbi:TPM domain-containing protein [Myxococcota bacterium]|nr:TPM domain-containing protein [Myxococcota bacterium]